MSRTSEFERLFFKEDWESGSRDIKDVVSFNDPERFVRSLPDVMSWAFHDLNALTGLLSLATNEDEGCSPSDTLVNDCVYALGHITDMMKTFERLECQARAQIQEKRS